MAANMGLIAKNVSLMQLVSDRFHVKSSIRLYKKSEIKYRWQAIDQENEAIEAKNSKKDLNLYTIDMILLTITS
jgi:hypothetical protein